MTLQAVSDAEAWGNELFGSWDQFQTKYERRFCALCGEPSPLIVEQADGRHYAMPHACWRPLPNGDIETNSGLIFGAE